MKNIYDQKHKDTYIYMWGECPEHFRTLKVPTKDISKDNSKDINFQSTMKFPTFIYTDMAPAILHLFL